VNGLTLLAIIALSIGVVAAYRAGLLRGRRDAQVGSPHPLSPVARTPELPSSPSPSLAPVPSAPAEAPVDAARAPAIVAPEATLDAERARLVRAYAGEIAALSRRLASTQAERVHLAALAEERRDLHVALAAARGETARYRELVLDVEDHAPSRFLGGPGSADDLKLIVGVGPMLERMLHRLGVTTYRQIAHWSERDIDEFDAQLPEFPGRIRRDAWVTQARALHQSKYGTPA